MTTALNIAGALVLCLPLLILLAHELQAAKRTKQAAEWESKPETHDACQTGEAA